MAKTIAGETPVRLVDVIDDEEIVVTKDGEPIARVVPVEKRRRLLTFEELCHSGRVVGDILESVDE
ncbi:MAG TPA: type II toxin-antitoxin system prevent-host-death family antitoxin [Thermoanaerobaculia bacterium]|jgi:prevent-host-death family protein